MTIKLFLDFGLPVPTASLPSQWPLPNRLLGPQALRLESFCLQALRLGSFCLQALRLQAFLPGSLSCEGSTGRIGSLATDPTRPSKVG
jgi:hypothetical protein